MKYPYTMLCGVASVVMATFFNGCTTNVQSNPPRTATEELLISSAAERAAQKLALNVPPHAHVFIDNSNFEGTDGKYALACIGSRLLESGAQLVDDRKKADIIVQARTGALSIDRKTFMIGIPQFNIPLPLAATPLPFPQISFFGTEEQKGVAKLAVTGYSAKNGELVDAQEPQYGFSHNTKKTVLLFISWTDSDYLPEDAEENKAEHKKKEPYPGSNDDAYASPAEQTTSDYPSINFKASSK